MIAIPNNPIICISGQIKAVLFVHAQRNGIFKHIKQNISEESVIYKCLNGFMCNQQVFTARRRDKVFGPTVKFWSQQGFSIGPPHVLFS